MLHTLTTLSCHDVFVLQIWMRDHGISRLKNAHYVKVLIYSIITITRLVDLTTPLIFNLWIMTYIAV